MIANIDAAPSPWRVKESRDPCADMVNVVDANGTSLFCYDSGYGTDTLTLPGTAKTIVDNAATVAELEWEWAAQIKEHGEWKYLGLYGPDEPWGPEEVVKEYQDRCGLPGDIIRYVRRMVGPVEEVEA